MNFEQKKQQLINEYNALETRQREIIGALKLIEEEEQAAKKEEEKKKEEKPKK